MSAANWGFFLGVGLNIFLSGPKRPPSFPGITIGAKIITHTTFIVGELIQSRKCAINIFWTNNYLWRGG